MNGLDSTNTHGCHVTFPENMKVMQLGNNRIITPNKSCISKAKKVNFSLRGNSSNGLNPTMGALYNKENQTTLYFFAPEVSGALPEGVYDAFVCFNDKYDKTYIVIKENVEVKDGLVIEFDADKAVNKVTYQYYDEKGEELFRNKTNKNGQTIKGNLDYFVSNMMLCHKDYGMKFAMTSNGNYKEGHKESFYINTPSNKYYIGTGTCAIKLDYTKYIFKNLITDFKTQIIESNPNNLIYRESLFVNTPISKEDEKAHFQINTFTMYSGGEEISNVDIAYSHKYGEEYKTMKFWLDCPMSGNEDKIEFDVMFRPRFNDYLKSIGGGKSEKYSLRAPGYIGNKESGVKLFNNGTDVNASFNKTSENKRGKMYPCNPYFSFNAEESTVFGNSAPTCSFLYSQYKKGNNIKGELKVNYIGRYGEIYESSGEVVNPTIKTEQIEGGKHKISAWNKNVLVDGIVGENVTTAIVDSENDDFIAPTLHLLTVLDFEGKVQDHLNSVKGAKVIMAGGDYDYTYDENKWYGYFSYKDAIAEVYYTINGMDDDWKKLDVKVVPEKFVDQVYGAFYEIALDDIKIEKPDSWLDLKIVLTDEAGNCQEQIIRPVIHVRNVSSSIKEEYKDSPNILIFNNIIRISGENKGRINIYSLDGKCVMSNIGNTINIENLASGSYVVNVVSNANVLNKKFIKR